MKYLILVSHGGLAEGLKNSLGMFAGDKIDQVIAVGLQNGKSVTDFEIDFRQAIAHVTTDDSVVVLADIVGGSPLTTACNVLAEIGLLNTAVILGGMNLPMAVTSVLMKDTLEGDLFVQAVLPEASAALQEFKAVADEEGEEDEI